MTIQQIFDFVPGDLLCLWPKKKKQKTLIDIEPCFVQSTIHSTSDD